MSEVPVAAGPPCEVCGGAEPAYFSLMVMQTYETMRVGLGCAPEFLAGLAASMTAPETPQPGPPPPAAAGGDRSPGQGGTVCQAHGHDLVEEPHTCPYLAEIHGDQDTLCRCCLACQDDCASEI